MKGNRVAVDLRKWGLGRELEGVGEGEVGIRRYCMREE